MGLTCLSDKKLDLKRGTTGHSTRFEKVSSVSGFTANVFRYFHCKMSTCELVQSVRRPFVSGLFWEACANNVQNTSF